MKILRKNLNKNYLRSKNRHFKVFFKNKFDIYNLPYLIIISSTLIKNINFISIRLLLSCIIYYFMIILYNVSNFKIYLILKL